MPDERLLTTTDVARRYGVTDQTVREWMRDGLPLSAVSLRDPVSGRLVRAYFWPADVEAYVAARKTAGRWGVGKRGPNKVPRGRTPGSRRDRAAQRRKSHEH